MNTHPEKTVYNIPAGQPFAKTLAGQLLEETGGAPEKLAEIRIFLPTRRACRVLREAFLQISGGKPLILPHMQPLGDIEEEELSLSAGTKQEIEDFLDLPPGILSLQRQLMLAKLIAARTDFEQGFDHALALANALGRFMDQVYTENLRMSDLDTIVPAEFAAHWQITLQFLEIIGTEWPKILKEQGVIDIADRRNRLILALSHHWQKNPPKTPVIAAGSTGSIPAVAELLSTIADLPQGQIILPGLDQNMDTESWEVLEESHPQYGFKQLLEHMQLERNHVQVWPSNTDIPTTAARRTLANEIMRPTLTSGKWAELVQKKEKQELFKTGFENLAIFECGNEREEAATIATLMRGLLEEPQKTAALITPNRTLARRVAMACQRWNIQIDDSGGQSLDQTSVGSFLRLILQACQHNLAPSALLALLKHRLCNIDSQSLHELEILALRGPKPEPGFAGLYAQMEKHEENTQAALMLLKKLEPILTPLSESEHAGNAQDIKKLLKSHIHAAEKLADKEKLWSGEDGEEAANLLSELLELAGLMPPTTLYGYGEILGQLFQSKTVRPAYGMHPRLMILGQLEARLIDADLIILGGLNEGAWPPDPGYDPWMSRSMRKDFGLPGHERSISLSAHDFVQNFCAPHVVLTRAKESGGTPTVPARWLQRLRTVLDAAGLDYRALTAEPHVHWAQKIDHHDQTMPCERPQPCPPVSARPREISATGIETWLKDPYSIYARHILKLKKLDPVEQEPDAALRGTILHDILHRFVRDHPGDLPENANHILKGLAHEEIEKHHNDPSLWSFWWPRFERLSQWYIAHEQTWRKQATPHKVEIQGKLALKTSGQSFDITARADRIDKTSNGTVIIDYKSGGTFSQKALKTGELPQLPVEALILTEGGFPDIPAGTVSSLSYWVLTGGTEPGKITAVQDDMETLIERTRQGLTTLIENFDKPDTPYYSLPRPDKAPRFNDYEHLARIKEWTALDDGSKNTETKAA